eukprot:265608-Heterocapsa_arctica.AAC.1
MDVRAMFSQGGGDAANKVSGPHLKIGPTPTPPWLSSRPTSPRASPGTRCTSRTSPPSGLQAGCCRTARSQNRGAQNASRKQSSSTA